MSTDSYKQLVEDILRTGFLSWLEQDEIAPCKYFNAPTCGQCKTENDFRACGVAAWLDVEQRVRQLEQDEQDEQTLSIDEARSVLRSMYQGRGYAVLPMNTMDGYEVDCVAICEDAVVFAFAGKDINDHIERTVEALAKNFEKVYPYTAGMRHVIEVVDIENKGMKYSVTVFGYERESDVDGENGSAKEGAA